ncbi:MAG: polyprenol monophosphomannose synthase [Candidatus Omnitrophica bacterium]|nr:polyprenol monophosphomannose synthase [Candidatus Omnitrophota bacterium]
MEEGSKKLVIIPTYNESEVITDLVGKVLEVSPDADILVVDDNSPDGTGDIIDGLSNSDGRINCLHRSKKEGIGPAYIDGFKWAIERGYDHILQMDADFSHGPEYVPHLFKLAQEYDLVIGSRYVPGGGTENWGVVRKIISIWGSLYAQAILWIPIKDLTGGFKCWNKRVLENIGLNNIQTKGYAFQIETTYRAFKKGYRIKEYPIVFTDRRVGETKMSRKIFIEAIFAVLRMRIG